MSYAAEILADTIAPCGVRLTTFKVTFPRFILAEFNTHRALSRNAASSRAIPVRRLLEQVEREPFIPEHWGANEPGMQATRDAAAWPSPVVTAPACAALVGTRTCSVTPGLRA